MTNRGEEADAGLAVRSGVCRRPRARQADSVRRRGAGMRGDGSRRGRIDEAGAAAAVALGIHDRDPSRDWTGGVANLQVSSARGEQRAGQCHGNRFAFLECPSPGRLVAERRSLSEAATIPPHTQPTGSRRLGGSAVKRGTPARR